MKRKPTAAESLLEAAELTISDKSLDEPRWRLAYCIGYIGEQGRQGKILAKALRLIMDGAPAK